MDNKWGGSPAACGAKVTSPCTLEAKPAADAAGQEKAPKIRRRPSAVEQLMMSMYTMTESIPPWERQLLMAVAGMFLWPLMLLAATVLTSLIVTYFRLWRVGSRVILRRSWTIVDDENETPDIGLYWFGPHDCMEKHVPGQSNAYFDPAKPSVIYVHGFQRRTTVRAFRETMNWYTNDPKYGLDVNAVGPWLEGGWNVGFFYWNRLADEEFPQDSECKIWTSFGRTGMRYRKVSADGRVTYIKPQQKLPSVSQQLADILAATFADQTAAPYRLVGHSLGSQVVVHASKLLSVMAKRRGNVRLPVRVALLDVFGTLGNKAYCGGWPILLVVQREISELREQGVIFEQYQTSLIGRRGFILRSLTAFIQLDPSHIPWYNLKARHISAPYLYFLSFGEATTPKATELMRRGRFHSQGGALGCLEEEAEEIQGSLRAGVWWLMGYREVEAGDCWQMPPMARASDEEIRRLMNTGLVHKQWRGRLFVRTNRAW